MKRIKAIVGWVVIIALLIFALMNFQNTEIELLNVSLSAPLSYIIALAAVFGAVAGHALATAMRWAMPEPKPKGAGAAASADDDEDRAAPKDGTKAKPKAKAKAKTKADAPQADDDAIVAPDVPVTGAGHTAPGRQRDKNEDSMVVDNDVGLFIVCDGMGGHAAGEVASTMAATSVARALRNERSAINQVRRGDAEPASLQPLIEHAVQQASAEVYEAASERREWKGMGCALTLLLVADEDSAVYGHVGDTRLYRWRDHEVEQLTRDHSMGAALVEAGAMTDAEAQDSPMSHALTRCIGHDAEVEVDTRVVAMAPGDIFVLCSDGLADYLDKPAQLNRMIEESTELLPGRLVAFANKSGGHDNITVVAVQIGDV